MADAVSHSAVGFGRLARSQSGDEVSQDLRALQGREGLQGYCFDARNHGGQCERRDLEDEASGGGQSAGVAPLPREQAETGRSDVMTCRICQHWVTRRLTTYSDGSFVETF